MSIKTIWDSMNYQQRISCSAAFATLSGIATSLYNQTKDAADDVDVWDTDPKVWLLGIWILFFRIKAACDDHRHFGDGYQTEKPFWRTIGFLIAIVSWITWTVAAFLLLKPIKSAEWMLVTLIISTSWIAVHVAEMVWDKKVRAAELMSILLRQTWVLLNMCYALCLIAYLGYLDPVIKKLTIWPLYALLGLLAYDMWLSRSFPRPDDKPAPTNSAGS